MGSAVRPPAGRGGLAPAEWPAELTRLATKLSFGCQVTMRWTLHLDERDRMRDRFWLVLGVLLVALIISFASIGSRGVAKRGVPASLAERVTNLPNQLMEELA